MFQEEFSVIVETARKKVMFLESNFTGYLMASMLAGLYVGLAILFIYTSGGMLAGAPYVKIFMGATFGIALSLVLLAGSELFTGNNMIMTAGMLKKTVNLKQTIKLWVVCYLGNWIGAIIVSLMFIGAGLAEGPVGEFIAATTATKMSIEPIQLFFRGMLCNILVCLAVWCNYKLKSESGKLIMIFWCLFAFITSGYEHSIANMTLLTVGLLKPMGAAITLGGYFYNILIVTLGNIVGAILFLTIPYYAISKEKSEEKDMLKSKSQR
ncbi:formate/nitrite transporter family protein [Metaclostridioides mangenotii]|uniref:formate/nitrite transporter family protein n=1 Tax=Metaclostridioides mangenotii TaxID=1540 RepID=UPI000463485A|nr:formate/nitrite transporter family protein [Clostridioides mangenotii]